MIETPAGTRILVSIACLTIVSPAVTHVGAAEQRPNVILLMADDMGYEALGCNGGTSYATPLLDRIASQGMRFTNCYSQPVCTPSRVKIMTGRSNARNYTAFGVLIPEERTFGNIMKEAGYKTAIAGKWQLSGKGPGTSTHGAGTWMDKCGFDESCMWAYPHYLSPDDYRHYRADAAPGNKQGTSRFWNPGVIDDPDLVIPKRRRVRFAYDGRYKLYLDGRMYEVYKDWDEQNPLSMTTLSRDARSARRKLQRALDSMPAWEPDNSNFNGQHDPITQRRLEEMRKMQREQSAARH